MLRLRPFALIILVTPLILPFVSETNFLLGELYTPRPSIRYMHTREKGLVSIVHKCTIEVKEENTLHLLSSQD